VKTYSKPVLAAITANGEAINADQKCSRHSRLRRRAVRVDGQSIDIFILV
jgi:hypothetical protein